MGVSFDDLVFVTQGTGIRQATVAFPNGYVASVVIGPGTYGGNDNLYELAVGRGTLISWHLVYDTPITDDVLGHLLPEDVTTLLRQIADLPSCLQ